MASDEYPPFFFIFDHTILNDIHRSYDDGQKELQKYARFLQDYLIIRRAIIQTKKMVLTSREVFERLIERTRLNPKSTYTPNIWVATNDYIDISNLTYSNSDVLYKESIIFLASDISFKYPDKEVILASNSGKCIDKVLTIYARYGRALKKIEEAPFKINNCKEIFEFLKKSDFKLFSQISEMLKSKYDFI